MKRFLPFTLMLMLLFTCYGNALAVETGVLSSSVMSQYSAVMFQGSARGVVEISYAVSGTAPTMTSIVVSSIKIYTSNGNCVKTITGSTSNGLMARNTVKHSGTYSYSGVSKTSYYAIVTFSASVGGNSDTKQVRTNTVKAP